MRSICKKRYKYYKMGSIMDFKNELKNYTNIVEKELEKYIRKQKCLEKN